MKKELDNIFAELIALSKKFSVNIDEMYERVRMGTGNTSDDIFLGEIEKTREYDKLYEKVLSESVNVKYGVGSNLFGGYFCPSLIQHIVIGGVKKGKLQDEKPNAKRYHKFHFDSNNKLICIETHESLPFNIIPFIKKGMPYTTHFIDGNEQKQTAVVFSNFKYRGFVSICTYEDGMISSYANMSCSCGLSIDDFEYEKYFYDNRKKLIEADFIDYNRRFICGTKYFFKYSNDKIIDFESEKIEFTKNDLSSIPLD